LPAKVPPTALATTLHDPVGRIRPGVERTAAALRERFAGIVVNATHSTTAEVLRSLEHDLGAEVVINQQAEATIGAARRHSVERSLAFDMGQVLYATSATWCLDRGPPGRGDGRAVPVHGEARRHCRWQGTWKGLK
jgi:hypothetical protein